MNQRRFIFYISLFIFNSFELNGNCFVTWQIPSGRTGDFLISYSKALWVSKHFDIPLLLQPFEYSHLFKFDQVGQQFTKQSTISLKNKRINLLKGYNKRDYCTIEDFLENNTLYILDLYFFYDHWKKFAPIINKKIIFPYSLPYDESYKEIGVNDNKVRFEYMYQAFKEDEDFLFFLKQTLEPQKKINQIKIPKGTVAVALHVRKGGGHDEPYKSIQEYSTDLIINSYYDCLTNKDNTAVYNFFRILRDTNCSKVPISNNTKQVGYIDLCRPVKHPPDQYYIDQLKALIELIKYPLFVHIFTDDPNPENIAHRYSKALNHSQITFSYRRENNNHFSNVIEDMILMSKFDILIRPYSSLSQMAQVIGNYKLVISPIHGIWHDDKLIIDEILIESTNELENYFIKE